jgi:hypothetical protein
MYSANDFRNTKSVFNGSSTIMREYKICFYSIAYHDSSKVSLLHNKELHSSYREIVVGTNPDSAPFPEKSNQSDRYCKYYYGC